MTVPASSSHQTRSWGEKEEGLELSVPAKAGPVVAIWLSWASSRLPRRSRRKGRSSRHSALARSSRNAQELRRDTGAVAIPDSPDVRSGQRGAPRLIGWGQSRSGKSSAASRRSAAASPPVAQPRAEMFDAEPAVEVARRVPVKHLKIDPLPAALDRDRGKPGHQPPADPLSARRLGDKQIFEIHPGSAKPRREPGME